MRQALALALRLAALALLLLALAGVLERYPFAAPRSVLLLDDSASMRKRFPALFEGSTGFSALLDRFDLPVATFGARPHPAGPGETGEERLTDLAEALRFSLSLFPSARERREVLLVTDGLTDRAETLKAARELARRGVKVNALRPAARTGQLAVLDLHVPRRVSLWQPFRVKGRVVSSLPGTYDVLLLRDGVEVKRGQVIVDQNGLAEVEFLQEAGETGTVRYDIRLEQAPGSFASGEVTVAESPRTLLVSGDPGSSRGLAEVYRRAGIDVEMVNASSLPGEETDLDRWDVAILDDVPAVALAGPLEESLRERVGLQGMGLIVIGGRKGLGTEEYRDTAIEAMLPVVTGFESPPPPASISLVLAMDTSLSMLSTGRGGMSFALVEGQPRKIEIAKQSAAELVRVLRPEDRMGIIGNSSDLYWVHRLSETGDRGKMLEEIEGISAIGGGINFYSIVREAWLALRDDPSPVRHIMVFCDANDIDQYEVMGEGHAHDLIRRMLDEGVTLSVLAIGDIADKDIPFLRTAAILGGGDFYLISKIVALPRYFVSEYRKLASRYFVEENIPVLDGDYSSVIAGLESPHPDLGGVTTVTPRDGSRVPLVTSLGTPLVALGRYGKGRTAVFASDSGQRWAGGWVDGPSAPKFWLQLLFSVVPGDDGGAGATLSVRAGRRGSAPDVLYSARGGGLPPWDGLWAGPPSGGAGRREELVRTGLRRYRFRTPPAGPGFLRLSFHGDAAGGGEAGRASFFVPPPPEQTALPENWDLVDAVVKETGGRWIVSPGQLASGGFHPGIGKGTLYLLTVTIALTLLLAETAVRHHFWR